MGQHSGGGMSKRTPYLQVIVGKWIRIPKRGHTDACCGCGLVHVINYRNVGKTLEMQVAKIDKRKSAAMRRAKTSTKTGRGA
jgi:hypothetical protein